MTNGTVILRVDAVFLPPLRGKLSLSLLTFKFPVQLGHELFRAEMRLGVAVAFNTPRHRQLLVLINHFHLIDSTMAGLATDARVDVRGMIEIDKFRQVVNSLPSHAATGFPALMNRSQLQ